MRLKEAKTLVEAGKHEEARGWLLMVVGMRARPEIIDESRGLLAQIEKRKAAPSQVSVLGTQAPATPRTVKPLSGPTARSTPQYFAQTSVSGPIERRQLPRSIGVLEGLDQSEPIGTASEVGWTDEDGLALWRLTVRGAGIPGRWVIVDRRFVAAPK